MPTLALTKTAGTDKGTCISVRLQSKPRVAMLVVLFFLGWCGESFMDIDTDFDGVR